MSLIRFHDHDTVLITGGCGAIGSVLINYLKDKYQGTLFVNYDMLTYCGKEENIKPPYNNYSFYKGDISDSNMVKYVLEKTKPTLVIHLAAETHVDQSFGNSLLFTRTNIYGTHVLLESLKEYGKCKLLIHMSTDEVYGSVNNDEICTEDSLFSPSNPYAATKAAAELICHSYIKSFNLPIIITRCNNVISPFQHNEKLIPQCIECLTKNKKIKIHGDGSSRRTFIDSLDIAKAIELIAINGLIGKIYNIGTNESKNMEYTVIEVVEKIATILDIKQKNINDLIEYIPDRVFQDYRYSIDSSKLRNLGWNNEVSFQEAVYKVFVEKSNNI